MNGVGGTGKGWGVLLTMASLAQPVCGAADAAARDLANELSREGRHEAAAIEYRRLALRPDAPEEAAAGYFWAAGYEYGQVEDWRTADRMLDRAEAASSVWEDQTLLLRGETARSAQRVSTARFYYETLAERDERGGEGDYAALRLAALALREARYDDAIEWARAAPGRTDERVAAIEAYRAGSDKSPALGGLLGMVPGLGYAYAGEYANALRSLILNGIFIWGMVATAEEEQWGGFAVITFFEFTWYSGSIYGGIDAGHRYNRNRLREAEAGILQGASYEPDRDLLPTVKLQFRF